MINMSDKKIDTVEELFAKSQLVKYEIEELKKIESIAVIYDGTLQSKNALNLGSKYATKFGISIDIILAHDYLETYKLQHQRTLEHFNQLDSDINNFVNDNKVKVNKIEVLSKRVKQTLDLYNEVLPEENKLSTNLLNKLIENKYNLILVGAPLFREDSDEFIGYYISKILRNSKVHGNVILVTNEVKKLNDCILSFVSAEQKSSAIPTLMKRSLSFASKSTDIKLVGLIDHNFIETIAENQVDEGNRDLSMMRENLKKNMDKQLHSFKLKSDFEYKSITEEVKVGVENTILKDSVLEHQPSLVMVRTTARLGENLEVHAETMTRKVLSLGYPVMLVWD